MTDAPDTESPAGGHVSEIIERRREHNQRRSVDPVYRVLLNELLVLVHSKVREHLTMVELIGISFQITGSGRVWPELTMKRTVYSDLETLRVSDRVNTSMGCPIEFRQDITSALRYLHRHGEFN